ncbi:MAG TPA: type II toxin-antitoxin system VapB family antitoxin [Steroidobacteraceae bacterium]|nr:type II toxin-antitoxin system VapB family antitoxin [Steroidobacteraceae bacterium]
MTATSVGKCPCEVPNVQELRFPADVKEVRIRKQGDGLFISPVKPNWSSFFAMQVDVPDDFLENRNDSPAQSRDPL